MAKIYRVVVRGQFDRLPEDIRHSLVAEAADHDIFNSAFTPEGCFTYDDRLIAFNIRYEVRDKDDVDSDLQAVVHSSIERASRWLDSVGVPHKHLRATATDMSTMWS